MGTTIDSFTGTHRFLSNFYPSAIAYPTVEHWYQAAKTKDQEWVKRILTAKTPGEAKRLGRQVPIRENWDAVKLDLMQMFVTIKFMDPRLLALLQATGDAELIEGNMWHDNYWGACTCTQCEDVPKLNHLGKILMDVRSILNGQ